MTEPTRDENEVVENPPEQQTPPEAAGPAERRRGSGLAGTVSVLALLVAAASAAAAYYVWNQDQARLAALSAQVEALSGEFATLDDNATIQALRRELRIETQALGDTEQQLGQRLDTVESAIQGMQDLTLRGQRGWRIAEVEYLMRIATHRLRLMRDVEGTCCGTTDRIMVCWGSREKHRDCSWQPKSLELHCSWITGYLDF